MFVRHRRFSWATVDLASQVFPSTTPTTTGCRSLATPIFGTEPAHCRPVFGVCGESRCLVAPGGADRTIFAGPYLLLPHPPVVVACDSRQYLRAPFARVPRTNQTQVGRRGLSRRRRWWPTNVTASDTMPQTEVQRQLPRRAYSTLPQASRWKVSLLPPHIPRIV